MTVYIATDDWADSYPIPIYELGLERSNKIFYEYEVIDEYAFMLAVVKYGIKFKIVPLTVGTKCGIVKT